MKKIIEPKLSKVLDNKNINEVSSNKEEDFIFESEICSLILEDVEFNSCKFNNIVFKNKNSRGIDFIDCIVENSDLSNLDFSRHCVRRVIFKNCKLIGCDFSECSLDNVIFDNCDITYGNFSYSRINSVLFKEVKLNESSFYNIEWKYLYFDNCNLYRSDFSKVMLNEIDFRNSKIEGIHLDLKLIRGLKVNTYQAGLISLMLGIIIED